MNHVHELNRDQAWSISSDPLMKYSSAFQGIFHRHVFICESDSDCTFYGAILDLQVVRGDTYPDALFTHAGGKHRMSKVASALRALGVPVSVIVDMDILNEERTMQELFSALGGDWGDISESFKGVKLAIEQRKAWANAGTIIAQIQSELEDMDPIADLPKEKRKRLAEILKQASPWDAIKQAGKSAIPNGLATVQFQALIEKCSELGLRIVPVGEMEGFCKSERVHGPKWVQKILLSKNLESDPELEDARAFIKLIWDKAKAN